MNKNGYLIELAESSHTDFGRVAFEDQGAEQQVFSAIWELESQVNNGGFDQFFHSCSSAVIAYAAIALQAIGARHCAGIVERAVRLISPAPETEAARYAVLDELDDESRDRLEELDAEFFAYPDNLTELLYGFVSLHPTVFGSVPD